MWKLYKMVYIYIPNHFDIDEWFPPEVEDLLEPDDQFGESLLWLQINPLVTMTADRLRERYGPAIMNTWKFAPKIQRMYGGIHKYRGWRPRNCATGAKLSQHKMGCAADIAFADVSAEKVREDLLNDPFDPTFEFITAIETGISWFHFSCQPHDKANRGVLRFTP